MKKQVKYCSVFLIVALMLFLGITFVSAAPPGRVITNSENWRDVYSSMLFSSLNSYTGSFLVSDRHSTLILGNVEKDVHLWLHTSQDSPFILGYPSLIESRGYTVEEFTYDNMNLELGEELTGISHFIIIDDSYGYNAIAVAPYAVVSKSWVLFADRNNIDEIEEFLSARSVDSVLIYGTVDREVRLSLEPYTPEIINNDGDRFENNIDIVKKYMEITDAKQIILTNGEFIEREIMSGTQPVVFIGQNNVPDPIREFIQASNIEVGVLIGNELVGSATFIRRQIGISVFVKFAQGARQPGTTISQVEALDMFYLPTYNLNLELDSAKYNKATNQLEITLRNTVEQAIYFKGTYSVDAADGSSQTVGDTNAEFIDGNSLKTMVYDLDPLPEGDTFADIFIVYGESKNSLERMIDDRLKIETVSVLDNCEIGINQLLYNKNRNLFSVEIENVGDASCYVQVELRDVIIDDQQTTVSNEDIAFVEVGGTARIPIDADLTDADIEENRRVTVRANYGERKNNLVKFKEAELELLLSSMLFGLTPGDLIFWSLLLVIILMIILIIYKRRKEQEKYLF